MPNLVVTSRDELTDALAQHAQHSTYHIIIDSPAGVWLPLELPGGNLARVSVRGVSSVGPVRGSATVSGVWGSATVRDVRGSATVRDVWGSATVSGVWGSATVSGVWGSATVRDVRGSATVRDVRGSATVSGVWGSATVRDVWGSATVRDVRGSATVRDVGGSATVRDVWGTAILRLHDNATATNIGPYVTVLVHSKTVTVDGGHIIDLYSLDGSDPATWCALAGVTIDDAGAHLYKAVDDNYMAGHEYTPTAYPVGVTVTDPAWRPGVRGCGYGLHACPTPRMARDHFSGASRFLEVVVPVAELVPIDETKCKSRSVYVVCEVTVDGERVSA